MFITNLSVSDLLIDYTCDVEVYPANWTFLTTRNAWHMWGERLSWMAIIWYEIKTNKFLWKYILTLILRSTTVYGFWKIVDVLQTSNSQPLSKKYCKYEPRKKERRVSIIFSNEMFCSISKSDHCTRNKFLM